MWKKFKQDMKERFMNFETAKGVYLIPAGAVVTYIAYFHVEFGIQVALMVCGIYAVYEGLRKTFVNRVKQAGARKKLFKDREKEDALGN